MTLDDIKKLGFVMQPDGSFSKPQKATSMQPSKPQKKAAAGAPKTPTKNAKNYDPSRRLSDAVAQQNSRSTLDGTGPRKAEGKARVVCRITRYAPRSLDADNFAGGCKPLIDQLRYAGLIPDDDPGSVELQFSQEKCRGKGWTKVEITNANARDHRCSPEASDNTKGNFENDN